MGTRLELENYLKILKLQALHFNYVFAVAVKEQQTPVLHLKHVMTEDQFKWF
jgi:hypothetical protein